MARGSDHWMQTYTGKRFYPAAPRAEDICLEDIAHALSLECRFGGHVKQFYSVAQHSLLVAGAVFRFEPLHKGITLRALLHDASEAYLKDLPRPLKLHLPDYEKIETDVQDAIDEAFQTTVGYEAYLKIKQADRILLATERRDLLRHQIPWDEVILDEQVEPLTEPIKPMGPAAAEALFLAVARWLIDPFIIEGWL